MVIPHGTHLLPHFDKNEMKAKYGLQGKHVLSTFGLLSAGKSIETTLQALYDISKQHPEVVFLIIGKTHPNVVDEEGEAYREKLQAMVYHLGLEKYVQFIDEFPPLPTLLEYLQLTDIYLFTSKDRNQAVSGTFSYAISCGCPIVSTPIPHAKEVLQDEEGLIFDFENSQQLATLVNDLLRSETLRDEISARLLQRMAPTAWDNSAIAHAMLFEHLAEGSIKMKFNLPRINLNHIKQLTDDFAMIQF
jgi:glycosyltransferase involved in cell wall biosynthesis